MSCYQSWVVDASCMDGFFSRSPPCPQLVETVDESLGCRWAQCHCLYIVHSLYKQRNLKLGEFLKRPSCGSVVWIEPFGLEPLLREVRASEAPHARLTAFPFKLRLW